MHIAILGAGITGLALGNIFFQRKKAFTLIEKEPVCGGLCRTNRTGNYRWDFGVHALYSIHQEISRFFREKLPNPNAHFRNAKIFHTNHQKRSSLLSYPFELGIKDLPLKERWECILTYLMALNRRKTSVRFDDWIYTTLGSGIAKHFMIPYNRKIWSCPLSQIDAERMAKKISLSSPFEVLFSNLGKKTIGRAHQAKFIYPQTGVQELPDILSKKIQERIHLNKPVRKLIRKDKNWLIYTDDGTPMEADAVISTIPLPELLKMIDIPKIRREYAELKWNNTYFVFIGLKDSSDIKKIDGCHWVFFKGNEIFYRLTLMHNFSRAFAPCLVAEITTCDTQLSLKAQDIIEQVIKDLIDNKILLSPEKITISDIKFVPYTYPIPTIGMDSLRQYLEDHLKPYDLFLAGRSGNWEYLNIDEIMHKLPIESIRSSHGNTTQFSCFC